MSSCPPADRLAELLADRVVDPERYALESHLGECTRCQEVLKQLEGEPRNWAQWQRLLAAHPGDVSGNTIHAQSVSPQQVPVAGRTTNFALISEGPVIWPTISGYEILAELGRGGMGVVYKAVQLSLNRVVAIKVILAGPHATADVLERFRTEALVLARLQHPHIVQVHEVGEQNGLPYFVMEYVDGESLARQSRTPYPLKQAAELVELLARAMHAAHQQGVIHRDLKPANVLLGRGRCASEWPPEIVHTAMRADPSPLVTVKITDFGLAKQLDATSGLTQTGQLMGTPSYMAPEQARGDVLQIGPPADVYALGATLYEALTGRPPFAGTTALETIQQVLHADPVAPGRLRPGMARDLETICLKCLEKSPVNRYGSAAALADDLRRFLTGEPIRGRRVSMLRRLGKWSRRRPALAALTATTCVAVAALLGIWLQFTTHLRSLNTELQVERDQASQAKADALAVLDFFEEKLLASGRPEGQQGGLGKDVTLRQALDAAEQAVAAAFHDRPLVEASIRTKIGLTYFHLGEYALALPQCERALELRTHGLGLDHPDTLSSMTNLAGVLWKLNHWQRALPLLEEIVERCQSLFGPNHDHTLRALNNLGLACGDAGQLERSCRLLEESLELHRTKYGAEHEFTVGCINNLAVAHFAGRRVAQALPLWQDVLRWRQDHLGAEHPATLQALHNLAVAWAQAGRLEEAAPLLEQALRHRRTKLGSDHPDTITTLNSLAGVHLASARPALALPFYEEVCRWRRRQLGSDHPATVGSLGKLAVAYRSVGRFDAAASTYQELLAIQSRVRLGDELAGAETLFQLGSMLLKCGRLVEAEAALRQCWDINRVKRPQVWATFRAQLELSAALLAQRHYVEAEKLLLEVYEALKDRSPSAAQLPLLRTDVLTRLIELYDAWGKPERADGCRHELPAGARIQEGLQRHYAWPLLWGWPRG
jgi:serine/threonine protein kinase